LIVIDSFVKEIVLSLLQLCYSTFEQVTHVLSLVFFVHNS